MKELSIEEKAKRYDSMFERLKEMYNNNKTNVAARLICERYFPELKESEDERIRKELLSFFIERAKYTEDSTFNGLSSKEIIAWLEKQGEQKPAVIIPKFRVGDEIKTSNEESLTITKIDEKGYWSEDLFICGFDDADKWELVEQKPVDKVEPKFKIGDVIVEIKPNGYCQPVRVKYIGHGAYSCESDDGKRFLSFPVINQDDYELVEQKPAEWNTNDEQMLNSTIKDLIHPCYEEIPDRIEEEIKWIKSMRNRVVSQPKQEWSEEDEEIHRKCICAMRASACGFPEEEKFVEQVDNWLKSLRPQKQWKPSDEQMNALNYVVNLMASSERPTENDLYYNILKSLRQQLMKLKDEK